MGSALGSMEVRREERMKRALLAAGLVAGALIAYVLYEFFDPVNLFALRLGERTVGTTNPRRSRSGWRSPSSRV